MATAVKRAIDQGVEQFGLKDSPELLLHDWLRFISFDSKFIWARKVQKYVLLVSFCLCLWITLPIASARATEASLPLGNINPSINSKIVRTSPDCSQAVVPGISAALSVTLAWYEYISMLYFRQHSRARQQVMTLLIEAISIEVWMFLPATGVRVVESITRKEWAVRCFVFQGTYSKGRDILFLFQSRNFLFSSSYPQQPFLRTSTFLGLWSAGAHRFYDAVKVESGSRLIELFVALEVGTGVNQLFLGGFEIKLKPSSIVFLAFLASFSFLKIYLHLNFVSCRLLPRLYYSLGSIYIFQPLESMGRSKTLVDFYFFSFFSTLSFLSISLLILSLMPQRREAIWLSRGFLTPFSIRPFIKKLSLWWLIGLNQFY